MTDNTCLWCGQHYIEGMDGCCRRCWEKYQFKKTEKELHKEYEEKRAEAEKIEIILRDREKQIEEKK